MTGRNDPCRCGSGKKFKRYCMKDFAKGGSPTEKRAIMLHPTPALTVPIRAVPEHRMPQMMNFAMLAMAERMRLGERVQIEQEVSDA